MQHIESNPNTFLPDIFIGSIGDDQKLPVFNF
jgi:hypothetical protein